MNLIKCEDLTLAYEKKIIIDKLSFEINIGSYLCIVGENGTGKSTLIKGLLGLKKPNGGYSLFTPKKRCSKRFSG